MSREDVLKFVNSREWERKLSLEGDEFVIFPNYFKQPRNTLQMDIAVNTQHIHWWFWEKCFIGELGFSDRVNKKLIKHSVTFNVFVRASIAKVDTDIIKSRFPNYGPYLKRVNKEFETDNVDTLMQLNSSTQIEHAVMAIEILKLKLHKEIATFPQFSGLSGLSSELTNTSPENSDNSILTASDEISAPLPQHDARPVLSRGMSALDVKSITKVIDDLAASQDIPADTTDNIRELTFLERISPRLARKHKKRK
jgi:hypothetical protein